MKFIALLLFTTFLLVNVGFAKEVKFEFDVNSSGPEIYPCDAGIVHHDQEPWCHVKGTTDACDPETYNDDPMPGIRRPLPPCVCTGSVGSSVLDFLRYTASRYDEQTGTWSSFERGTVEGRVGAQNTLVKKMWPENTAYYEFKTQLEAVQFNLESERYGAEYFVDICYRGPQIDYFAGIKDPWNQPAPFSYKMWLTMTDFDSGNKSYVDLADPSYAVEFICDRQGMGQYQYGHNGTEPYDPTAAYDTFDMDIRMHSTYPDNHTGYNVNGGYIQSLYSGVRRTLFGKTAGSPGSPGPGTADFYENTGWHNILSANTYFPFGSGFNVLNPGSEAKTPRFCKARFRFREDKIDLAERAWQRHDARVAIKVNIEEREPGE